MNTIDIKMTLKSSLVYEYIVIRFGKVEEDSRSIKDK
jgi:hypothetical protein